MKLLVLLALVALATAYEFEDPIFNNFLKETLDEGMESRYLAPLNVRSRREVDVGPGKQCGFHSQINCCGEAKHPNFSEKHKELKGKCFAEALARSPEKPVQDPLSCEHLQESKKKLLCLSNCIAEGAGIIENGQINVEKMKAAYVEFKQPEDWQVEIFSAAVNKCLPIAKEAAEKYPAGEGDCSPLAIKMWHCVWKETQKNCPQDKVQKTPVCEKIHNMLMKDE